MSEIHSILKQYWGYDQFRPMQESIIESVLSGKDTLALLPTGGGKSICFQVPAMARDGLCLVISPLIALMKDQVENLRKKGITAFAIYSGLSRREVINILKLATNSNCKFLYVSPERLETNLFKEYLPALDISLLAVDEAHCISQWGYDFRPPYLRIAALREELRNVPVLALTASATPVVQKDICEKLAFKNEQVFRRSFERPNLSYSVFTVDSKINKIVDILQKVPGSSIVYCKSRRRTKEISDLLNLQGIRADYYHAGLTQEQRSTKQEQWIKNDMRTIVCTNAFGMGIDKPDVRIVIHADVPDCLENYYQEAGRAGRDEKKSYAVLLHNEKELEELRALPDTRFPTLENIRLVYQALMNYLQVPAVSGAGNYFDFDLTDFLNKFKLDAQLVMHGIKALEQEEYLSFNELIFVPAKVQFVTGKDYLYEFEANYPQLEPLIKALLRSYEGIFDLPVNIHEKSIAYTLRQQEEEVVRDLKKLHGAALIEYIPVKDTPQIYLIGNRVKAEDMRINVVDYEKRKKQYAARIETMIAFVKEQVQCRSRVIAAYFGDEGLKPCKVCDNCLRQENKELGKEEFEKIEQVLMNALQGKSLPAKDLLQPFTGIKKEKAWRVLEFLQAEEKVRVDARGNISRRQ
jgi:ATP-dependent DNA helicase RecQ